MIIIDNALERRAAEGRPVRVGLIGAGFMGRGIANQIVNSVRGMALVAIGNRTVANAERAFREAGVENFDYVSRPNDLEDCIANGIPAITDDALMLPEVENIDVLIEATGSIEFGARFAMKAIACGKDVVSMNAELDATVGSVLQQHAQKAGVIFSISDGDQPGVQMNLWRYVKFIGLQPLVCGNIKGLQDPYRNPTTQKAFAEKWGQNPSMVTSFADGSKISFEQACVANATGMKVEQRGMRGGIWERHVDELCVSGRYDVGRLKRLGGVVDYIVGGAPPPGVFVLAAHGDPKQRHMLNLYKLGPGPLYSFYTPYHLCHFEIPLSAARVFLFRDIILAAERPQVDVITKSKTNLKAGERLDGIGGYLTYGECENYEISRAQNLLPQGLAEGCTVKRDVRQDTPITYADVELPPGRLCDQLRQQQDAMFPSGQPENFLNIRSRGQSPNVNAIFQAFAGPLLAFSPLV
ncbi:MAG TPA: Gfo/Idh/MocA family oxidoreductase [Chthoniobacterales bacterium]